MAIVFAVFVSLSLVISGFGYSITNGQLDGEDHPYVCIILTRVGESWYYGSGVQISETVIVTAGHVTDGAEEVRIFFDSDATTNPGWPFGGLTGTPHTHPDYSIGASPTLKDWISHDVGVIVLDASHILSDYGQLPDVNLVDGLPMKTRVDQVGYGVQERSLYPEAPHGPPDWYNQFVRMYAPAELITSNHKWSDEFLKTTANPSKDMGGTCFGDSGGPVLLGGTNIVIGVTSWGTNYPCKGVSYASRIDTADILQFINSFP